MTSPRVLAAIGAVSLALAWLPAPAAEMPSQIDDVNESFRLLTTTYYHPVGAQIARGQGASRTRRGRASAWIAALRSRRFARPTMKQRVTALDDEIVSAAQSSHATVTQYAYAAIAAMAKAVDDKYTVFMDPDQFKAFKEELDPQKISGIGVLDRPGRQRPNRRVVRDSRYAGRARWTADWRRRARDRWKIHQRVHHRRREQMAARCSGHRRASCARPQRQRCARRLDRAQRGDAAHGHLQDAPGRHRVRVRALVRARYAGAIRSFDRTAQEQRRKGARARSAQRRRRLCRIRARNRAALHREQTVAHGRTARRARRRP